MFVVRPTRLALATFGLIAGLAIPPARADFFDGARKTLTSDIPHFFQDDIPCAFGGKPTSHTRTACKSGKPNKPDHPTTKPGDGHSAR